MGRPLQVEWQEDVATLERFYHQEKDSQDRTRLQALWLVRRGQSLSATADVVGVHYSSVQRWVEWYRVGGLKEVLSHRCGGAGGPVSRLNEEAQEQLRVKACAGEIKSVRDGIAWARQEQGVSYSYGGMRYLFEGLDLRCKVPRPRAPQASAQEQAGWKKGGSVRL
jgi:transposase